jgi:MoxR-like ATPase
MPDSNDEDALRVLISSGDKGFTPALMKLLPRPWDASAPAPAAGSPEKSAPPSYIISKDLAAAAWVALLLRQPLLLTGDPGVGKTRFAEKLAHDLGLDDLAVVQVKSTMTGKELLYSFDDLARFRDAAVAGAASRSGGSVASVAGTTATSKQVKMKPVISYVQLQGLGRAIIRAAGASSPVVLDPSVDPVEVFGKRSSNQPLTLGDIFPREFDKQDGSPRHSIVLVDELDKAPRDTPNDLLAEIEQMSFRFEELGFRVKADTAYKPIVVITSNAERNLPDAFLRRCVFHHIDTPTPETMRVIAAARLGNDIASDCQLMEDATELYKAVADHASEKRPGTAEFIALVAYLRSSGVKPDEKTPMDGPLAKAALRVVAKTNADLTAAVAWLAAPARKSTTDKA